MSLEIRLHRNASYSLPLRNPELASRQQIKQNFQKLLESMTKREPKFFVSFYYCSGSQTVVREGLQCGTRDPSVLLHKKKTFCLSLSRFVNKFLHFCVLPLLVSKNGHYNFSQPFCSCLICVKSGLPNFWSNEIGQNKFSWNRCFQGGTPWKYSAHKW